MVLLVLLALPNSVLAKDARVMACIDQAAGDFALSALTLQVLYRMEGGTLGKVTQNTNGTVDIGPMQINSWWLKKLAPTGITYQLLRDDPCTNVYVAAWIFQQELTREEGDVAMAIARYHSPTPVHQARYLRRVTEILDGMIAKHVASRPVAGPVAQLTYGPQPSQLRSITAAPSHGAKQDVEATPRQGSQAEPVQPPWRSSIARQTGRGGTDNRLSP